jgi:hypothetical protein
MVRSAASESNAFMSDCSDVFPAELICKPDQSSAETTNLDEVASKLANLSMLDNNLKDDYVEVVYLK